MKLLMTIRWETSHTNNRYEIRLFFFQSSQSMELHDIILWPFLRVAIPYAFCMLNCPTVVAFIPSHIHTILGDAMLIT